MTLVYNLFLKYNNISVMYFAYYWELFEVIACGIPMKTTAKDK